MKISRAAQYALGISTTVAIFAGCSGGTLYAPGSVEQNAAQRRLKAQTLDRLPTLAKGGIGIAVHPDRRQSWMSADAKKNNLLYISDPEANDVYVFSYRAGKLLGTLTGFSAPQGECVSKKGDVWIANASASQVVEYAHGGKRPIKTISEPGPQAPLSCAVDGKTGDLAVANAYAELGSVPRAGSVWVYADARGTPRMYSVTTMDKPFFVGYDDKGDLFVDGQNGNSFDFAELAQGGKRFKVIAVSGAIITFPGAVQWDGKYIAVGDQGDSMIYRLAISGSTGKIRGTTSLTGTSDVVQFWIQGPKIIGPDSGNRDVGFFDYPSGGLPTKTIDGFSLSQPIGAAVSKAEKQPAQKRNAP